MNPKTPITKEMKEEIHFLASGASDSVEAEPTHRGKKVSYDFEEVVSVLKAGKKYVLPSAVARVNTVYDLLEKLKQNDKAVFAKVSYGAVKGTVQKHEVVSKNKKTYSYTTAQYFLFIEK